MVTAPRGPSAQTEFSRAAPLAHLAPGLGFQRKRNAQSAAVAPFLVAVGQAQTVSVSVALLEPTQTWRAHPNLRSVLHAPRDSSRTVLVSSIALRVLTGLSPTEPGQRSASLAPREGLPAKTCAQSVSSAAMVSCRVQPRSSSVNDARKARFKLERERPGVSPAPPARTGFRTRPRGIPMTRVARRARTARTRRYQGSTLQTSAFSAAQAREGLETGRVWTRARHAMLESTPTSLAKPRAQSVPAVLPRRAKDRPFVRVVLLGTRCRVRQCPAPRAHSGSIQWLQNHAKIVLPEPTQMQTKQRATHAPPEPLQRKVSSL